MIKRRMRDVFIEQIYEKMYHDDRIFFLTDDMGAPILDKMKDVFRDCFINVGIAEQNLINVATGLALEGYTVYTYGIAPFLTMRAYEQIRINLSLLSQIIEINVNIIGVGIGLSYDVSGPTHHCLEDISIIRTLPNITIFSPSDWKLTEKFIDYSINVKKPKYLRFDGKSLPNIYQDVDNIKIENGFYEIRTGEKICIVSTGYMTHIAIDVADMLAKDNIYIGIIDTFLLKPIKEDSLFDIMNRYDCIVTLEESFINKGGLDSIISCILNNKNSDIKLKRIGFEDFYVFDIGNRDYLHKLNNIDKCSIIKIIKTKLLEK